MEKQIKWFSRNHVAANFLMGIVLLLGLTTWFQLKKEVFPELALDAVLVSVPFPNASPEEVETGVVIPIEEEIRSIEGVKRFTSSSTEGMGAVTIEVDTGYEVRDVMDDVKSKIDAITTFPGEAEKPIYEEFVIRAQVLSIAVSADTDPYTLRKIAQEVRDDLLEHRLPKPDTSTPQGLTSKLLEFLRGEATISETELAGVKPLELSIEISEDRLRQYNLTIDQVAQQLRLASVDLPGGSIKSTSGDVLIRVKGKLYSAEEFANVEVVTNTDGATVKLGDIAVIRDGFEDVDISSRLDGRSTALVNVFATGDEDTLAIAELAKDYVKNAAASQLPGGVQLEVWNDQSLYLERRIDLLMRSMTIGLLLVFIVLALFLRPSLAFLVALGIPVSFAGGIFFMPELGVSINMISLFAFILVLGIVVDDAIVVGENVYGMIRRGVDPREAAWKGTHEVGVVVIFGILTTMAAFTPMIGLDGVSGKIWPNIPYVVIPVLFFSLLQSKFVLPAHLAMLRPRKVDGKRGIISKIQHSFADGLEWCVEHLYRPSLKVCLRYRYVVLVGFIAIFGLTLTLSQTKMNFEFMPKVEGDIVSVKIEMPFGVKFENTQEAVIQMEQAALRLKERYKGEDGKPVVQHILTSAGTQPFVMGFGGDRKALGSHLGEVTIELTPAVNRPQLSAEKFINMWREEIGDIPGVVQVAFRQETAAGGNALDIEITGSDLNQVKAASNHIVEELSKIEGMKDIFTEDRLGKREFVFSADDFTEEGKTMKFTHYDVANQVRSAIFGSEVQRIQRGRDEVKVMVRYPKEERESLDTIDKIKLRTTEGKEVAMAAVIEGEPTRGQATIKHIDGKRAIKISADVDKSGGANANTIVGEFKGRVLDKLGEKFPGVTWGFQGEQRDQAESLNQMGTKFIFALLLMYVLIAIPLKSYLQPLIIMSVIPFGMVGAILGHYLLGFDLSVMSVCGLIALAGVVVNDSLVLVDYVNRHRKEDGSVIDAVWSAGARRFRPIMLTSMTTFAGLMPMLTETDMQARFLIPMAISLGFGILFATLITLILVPSIYLMLEDAKWLIGVSDKRPEEQ